MKKALAYISVGVIVLALWILQESKQRAVVEAKDTEIASLHQTVDAKDKLIAQGTALADSRGDLSKVYQDKLKADEDLLAKNQAELADDKATLKRVQDADRTIINSLKEDNQADIQSLKDQIEQKDEQIAQLNEKLVQAIVDDQTLLNTKRSEVASGPIVGEIYPLDDGFEDENIGSGFWAQQYYGGPYKNPNNVKLPDPLPKTTPWTFAGNSGLVANGSGSYLNHAANVNHDGKQSDSGQAAFLEYDGSSFSQTIKLPPGTYSVTFDWEARPNYGANRVVVCLDKSILFKGVPTVTDSFTTVTTDTIKFATAGEHELKFVGLGAVNDPNSLYPGSFIDNIRINILKPGKLASPKPGLKTTSLDAGAEPPRP